MTNDIYYPSPEQHEMELRTVRCCANCKYCYEVRDYKCELRSCGVPYSDAVYDIVVQPYNVCKEWKQCK